MLTLALTRATPFSVYPSSSLENGSYVACCLHAPTRLDGLARASTCKHTPYKLISMIDCAQRTRNRLGRGKFRTRNAPYDY